MNTDGFAYMHPRRLLKKGWRYCTRIGALPDAQNHAQMTPDELKKQLEIIQDLQDSQKKEFFEREKEEKVKLEKLNEDETRLVSHFKKIALGLKSEEKKFNWLEKLKPYNGKQSKYQQFKQTLQWYLYTQSNIKKEEDKILFACSYLSEGAALNVMIFPYPSTSSHTPSLFSSSISTNNTLVHKSSVTVTCVTSHITLTHITAYIIMISFMTHTPYL
jgi:hypothetical protein